VEGINLAVLFTEKNGEIRLSLRSKVAFSVNDFARKHFSGGGHDRAAGATSTKSMEDTITYFRSLLPQYKEQLNAL
jgi:phosphoesterase RecJ-like protein